MTEPQGSELREAPPSACPSGHRWPPPGPGNHGEYLVGHHPCGCIKGHRTWFCEKPGCPTPWVRRGWCPNQNVNDPIMWTWAPEDDEHHRQPDRREA